MNALILFLLIICEIEYAHQSLESLTVLFRHGDRTNDPRFSYPKNPYANYSYAPYGFGVLTNKGKQKSIQLGKQIREIYNGFLDSITTSDINLSTTDRQRANDTLYAVIDNLCFNKQVLNKSEWLSRLNVNIRPVKTDRVLSFSYFYCPRYNQLFHNYEQSEKGQEILGKYKDRFAYVEEHTGIQITHLYDLAQIYNCLATESEWGLKPPEWVSYLPQGYFEATALDFYKLLVALPEFNRLYGGFLLKEVLNNIDNTIKLNKKSLYIYSGHDTNVIALLGALKMYTVHIIEYLGCVIIELHKINNNHYVKVLYQQTLSEGFKQMDIPGCNSFCSLETFKVIFQTNIPQDTDNCNIL